MSRRTKVKPKSPADIAAERLARRARDFAAVNLPPEAAALAAHNDVEVVHAERDKVDGARRVDAFHALRDGMQPGAYDAARRLEEDMHKRLGHSGEGASMERVDSGYNTPAHIIAMIFAGKVVDLIKARLPDRDVWLLSELIMPTMDRAGWRGVVAYITGEENPPVQGYIVRAACALLCEAYKEVDAIQDAEKKSMAA